MPNPNKKNTIKSPNDFDQVIQHTSTKSWLLTLVLLIAVTAILTWSFFAEIPITIEANGILIHENGIKVIQTSEPGIINKLHVKPNQYVKKGTPIATLSLPNLLNEIQEIKEQISQLKNHRSRITKLKTSDKLIKQEELLLQIAMKKSTLKKLQTRYKENSEITSKYSGTITDIMVSNGDRLKSDDSILNIEPQSDKNCKMIAILYLHESDSNKIKTGLDTNLALSTFEPERFGLLKGISMTISEYPETKQGLMRTLRNDTLVDTLIASNTTTELRVALLPDKSTVSGYVWTSGKGPSSKLKSGTCCNGSIIISKLKPIKLIIPLLKDIIL